MQNLVRHRTMSDRTCLQLVEILGLPVTMTGNFCQIPPFFLMIQVKISHPDR